jgi:pimeloyl-ACP methyl ester carboxylesterase
MPSAHADPPPPPASTIRPRRSRARRRWRWAAALALLGALGLNVSAYFQARSMTVYAPPGEKTAPADALSGMRLLRALALGVRMPRPEVSDTPARHGWAFTTERLELPRGEWIDGWLVPAPEGRGLVVIGPGYAASRSDFLGAVASWRRLGYDAFLFDFRGAGGSSGRVTTAGIREAEDLARVIEHARTHFARGRPLLVYGYSMGGAAALRAVAELGARPDGLVVVAVFESLLGAVQARFRLAGLPAWPVSELMVLWGGVQHGFNGFQHRPVDYARRVNVPTLVLAGGRDTRAPAADAQAIAAALPGPKALHLFPEGTHVNITGGDPQSWLRVVAEFVAAIPVPGPRPSGARPPP